MMSVKTSEMLLGMAKECRELQLRVPVVVHDEKVVMAGKMLECAAMLLRSSVIEGSAAAAQPAGAVEGIHFRATGWICAHCGTRIEEGTRHLPIKYQPGCEVYKKVGIAGPRSLRDSCPPEVQHIDVFENLPRKEHDGERSVGSQSESRTEAVAAK